MSEIDEEVLIIVDPRLEKIIPKFLADQKSDFQQMEAAFAVLDYAELMRLGHRMKGGCGGFGFHKLGKLGGQIETSAESKNSAAISDLLNSMRSFFSQMKIKYEKQ